VGKGARLHRQQQGRPSSSAASRRPLPNTNQRESLRANAEASLIRLIQKNPPGKISLAGAFALGYAALGMAQREKSEPEWFHELDPLDTMFLGTAWPHTFRHGYEFANVRTAWLRLLRGTSYWQGIERFVREILAASEEHDLPVDDRELMLLLAERLEAIGLDQRKLPRNLLADQALTSARVVYGPAYDTELPNPPPDAAERVASVWAAAKSGLLDNATAADAVQLGLHLMAASRPGIRSETTVLLPALYVGLVASKYQDISKVGERSVAWALGLSADSPLVSVTDVLLVASQRELDPDTTLRHIFGLPAFTEPVRTEDRLWHSWPGRALIDLAFELGHPQVITREGKAIQLGRGAAAIFEAQLRRFEQKFGRPPRPGDSIFFDSNADQPQPVPEADLETETISMLEAVGISKAWIYAYQCTGGLLPRLDGTFVSERDRAEWDEAVDEYMETHEREDDADHEAETQKLQGAFVITTLQMAADDPEYGAALATQVAAVDMLSNNDVVLLKQYLRAWASELTGALRSERMIFSATCENARVWADADLPNRVQDAAKASADDLVADDVLLAVAVAVIKERVA
jgi:hypothetical protein